LTFVLALVVEPGIKKKEYKYAGTYVVVITVLNLVTVVRYVYVYELKQGC